MGEWYEPGRAMGLELGITHWKVDNEWAGDIPTDDSLDWLDGVIDGAAENKITPTGIKVSPGLMFRLRQSDKSEDGDFYRGIKFVADPALEIASTFQVVVLTDRPAPT
ncbi:hypothetical protein [Brucella intermedia]|uniref:hypothetical protein n=1 Tax=Brucella intermedia TaxID=94625 RepID=UPI00165CEFF0|nr:hypothetical protein [Brucella intermedia]QNQ40577.1 hypothetical protein IAR37_01705 [Brucella intermedia]